MREMVQRAERGRRRTGAGIGTRRCGAGNRRGRDLW